jgi:hypothetical protein
MDLFESKSHNVILVYMTPDEALTTIQSLIIQMLEDSPNTGRYEQILKDGRDFSICIRKE